MKIVHLADVHLGASNRKLSAANQKLLKNQNASRLKAVFDYANKIGAEAIVISGDLFHSKNPSGALVKFFLECVGSVNIPVFYVKGNHDEDFLFSQNMRAKNLVVFDKFSTCKLGDVLFCGQSGGVGELPILDGQFNVCLLHGDIHSSRSDFIDLSLCKNKNINYLALGHIHTFESGKLDGDGIYAYPGCLTSNGFDECGDKGFIVLDTQKRQIQFVTLEGSKFFACEVDITGFDGFDDLVKKIESKLLPCNSGDFVRVTLVGSFEEEQDKFLAMLQNHFDKKFAYFELQDKSTIKLDFAKLQQEKLSFKSEFLRLVGQDESLSDQEKTAICQFGINALRGDDL